MTDKLTAARLAAELVTMLSQEPAGVWEMGVAGNANLVLFNGEDIVGLGDIYSKRRVKLITTLYNNVETIISALEAARPEARAQEPVAWAVYDEPTEELIDVTLVKPDGGEPGLRYEPLYMNCVPLTPEKP